MSEFYQGFWWCFPMFIIGFSVGFAAKYKQGKADFSEFGGTVLLAWAFLGVLALFSGFPVFEGLRGYS